MYIEICVELRIVDLYVELKEGLCGIEFCVILDVCVLYECVMLGC